MTPEQAQQLRVYIADYCEAAIAHDTKGAQDPADWTEIEENLKKEKTNLEYFIHHLTTPPAIGE